MNGTDTPQAQTETVEIDPQVAIVKMGEIKQDILNIMQARQNPTVTNIVRQAIDSLDTCYLFYTSLLGVIRAMDQAVDEKLAQGDVLQFPDKSRGGDDAKA